MLKSVIKVSAHKSNYFPQLFFKASVYVNYREPPFLYCSLLYVEEKVKKSESVIMTNGKFIGK